jgi:catechol 2,3-dioxygenase-like lactoylglutathione lyase family enzyme
MFSKSRAYSGFSTNDLEKARTFYADTLGLQVIEQIGNLMLLLEGGGKVLIYPKENHEPATFTVLNFPVDDIDSAVDALNRAGIQLERYEGIDQDERGIARDEYTSIAWFQDPAGNILSVLRGGG